MSCLASDACAEVSCVDTSYRTPTTIGLPCWRPTGVCQQYPLLRLSTGGCQGGAGAGGAGGGHPEGPPGSQGCHCARVAPGRGGPDPQRGGFDWMPSDFPARSCICCLAQHPHGAVYFMLSTAEHAVLTALQHRARQPLQDSCGAAGRSPGECPLSDAGRGGLNPKPFSLDSKPNGPDSCPVGAGAGRGGPAGAAAGRVRLGGPG